jgi:hypothetical protein
MLLDRHRVAQLVELSALERTAQGPERLLREEDVALLVQAAYDDATEAARAEFMARVKYAGDRLAVVGGAGRWRRARRRWRWCIGSVVPSARARARGRRCSCCSAVRRSRRTPIRAIACPTAGRRRGRVGAALPGARRLGHADDRPVDRTAGVDQPAAASAGTGQGAETGRAAPAGEQRQGSAGAATRGRVGDPVDAPGDARGRGRGRRRRGDGALYARAGAQPSSLEEALASQEAP